MQEKEQKLNHYEVTFKTTSETVTYPIDAATVLDAKTEMCKQYYGCVYTAQFKYMTARRVKEERDGK